jgi:hypothetical protein
MIKARARTFRYRKLLETGAYVSIEEMAAAQKINASYVSRILRMTLLRSRRRGGYPGRTALLRDLPSQIDAAVRVELMQPFASS